MAHLNQTVINQQNLITNMNQYIMNTATQFRIEMSESDLRYRDEKDVLQHRIYSLMDEIAVYKERELVHSVTRVSMDNALPRLTLVSQKRTTTTTKVKLEGGGDDGSLMHDKSLYTWQCVSTRSTKCLEIYGFTADQLQEIYTRFLSIPRPLDIVVSKRGGGCKPVHPQSTVFLATVHFFVHYMTFKSMSVRFGVSTSFLQPATNKLILDTARPLFDLSIKYEASSVPSFCYNVHFILVNRPADSNVAKQYFNTELKAHGLFVHCIHDRSDGRVISFYTSNDKSVDLQWIHAYLPNYSINIEIIPSSPVTTYITRMTSKFFITNTKFRGFLPDLPNIVMFLLALVNLDLSCGNPIKNNQETFIQEEDEDS